MAQKAIRDGEPLTAATYLRYGEWVNTEEIRAQGDANRAEVLEEGKTYIKQVTRCPWNLQFNAMGEKELGNLYCRYIDESIAAGFSKQFHYRVPRNLNQGVPCFHIIEQAGIKGPLGEKRKEYLKGFDYHCADLYYAFLRAAKAIFQEEGEEAGKAVFNSFREVYGDEMAESLESFAGTDFSA